MLKGVLALAATGLARPALALADAPRGLSLHNLHTGESLSAVYYEDGRYLPDALEAMNRLLRDHRTGDVHAMSPRLLDLVSTLSRRFEAQGPVQVISGYRSPATNAALHKASNGVASGSLHMQGLAMDIRIPGAPLGRLRDAALDLARGGVGFYPVDDFVHVDVGRVRRWQGAGTMRG